MVPLRRRAASLRGRGPPPSLESQHATLRLPTGLHGGADVPGSGDQQERLVEKTAQSRPLMGGGVPTALTSPSATKSGARQGGREPREATLWRPLAPRLPR